METEHIKNFIEDCIAGGWEFPYGVTTLEEVYIEQALLDPSFWKACGKTRGWWTVTPAGLFEFGGSPYAKGYKGRYEKYKVDEWQYKMMIFTYHLADGKSINDALGAISN